MSSILPEGSDSKSEPPAGMKPGDIVLVDLEHGSLIGEARTVGVFHVLVADGNDSVQWFRRGDVSVYVEPEDPRQALLDEVARCLLASFGMGLDWDADATPELREIFIRRAGQVLDLPGLRHLLAAGGVA